MRFLCAKVKDPTQNVKVKALLLSNDQCLTMSKDVSYSACSRLQ